MIDLRHGDCLEVMKTMEDNIIDLTVTSPPYDNLRTYKGSLDWNEGIWQDIIKELYRITKQGGVVVWVVGDATIKGSETGTSFRQALWAMACGFNLHDTMIYHRPSPNPPNVRYYQEFEYMFIFSKGKAKTFNPLLQAKSNKTSRVKKETINKNRRLADGSILTLDNKAIGRFVKCRDKEERIKSNIWYIPAGYMVSTKDKIAFEHPAIFPEKLANAHIISWSNEGDTVFDCLMGSGTTGKMAVLNNRNFIGIENVEEYFKISQVRIKEAQEQVKKLQD